MNYTLSLFNTGQITLPKAWRNKYNTKKFIATENGDSLIIKPLTENSQSVFYEDKNSFGIHFPEGMDPEVLIKNIKDLQNG